MAQLPQAPVHDARFDTKRKVEVPRLQALTHAQLGAIVSDRLGSQIILIKLPVLWLTARNPYNPTTGRVDVYMPGRWDTESNSIFMDTIVVPGQNSSWDGSVAYVYFHPQAVGSHLVAVHFTGYQTTATLSGPWGNVTASTATTSDSGVAAALWSATAAGSTMEFDVSFTSANGLAGLGYIESIQVFEL